VSLAKDTQEFNETILKSVEDGITSVLGKQVLESLFLHLEAYRGLPRAEIPSRLEVFFPVLEKAFGPITGKTLGRFIVKLVYTRLGLEFPNKPNQQLVEYVENARSEFVKEL
jgi:hypothetical protein